MRVRSRCRMCVATYNRLLGLAGYWWGMNLNEHDSAMQSATLSGRKGWLITDGKAGMVVQVRGVADALGLDYDLKTVDLRGLGKVIAPWGTVDRTRHFTGPDAPFAPPWPEVAIATGRASIPYLRTLRQLAGPACFTVVLQDPKSGRDTADLIWVPQHDRRRDINVFTTLASPHSFSPARLAALRAEVPSEVAALPEPRVTVVLGGKNAAYKYLESDDARFGHALKQLAAGGASFMVTTSRRTHQRLLSAVERATAGSPRLIWTGDGDNPYPQFLAHADAVIVTADSVNMTGEACATGRPVYVFFPSGGSSKFQRFHDALRAHGATRDFDDSVTSLEQWSYAPLHSAEAIATEIEARWRNRRAVLPGMMSQ